MGKMVFGGFEKLPTNFAWLGWNDYSNLYLILHQSRRLESRKIPYSRKITNDLPVIRNHRHGLR
jgi:hypothetical protein